MNGAAQLPAPARVGRDALEVVTHPAHRRAAGEDGVLPLGLRGVDRPAHILQVGHRAADALRRQLKAEVIVRLEQHVFRLHQPLPHGAVGRLSEVAALGVLQVRAARDERELHIRKRRAGEHARVIAL